MPSFILLTVGKNGVLHSKQKDDHFFPKASNAELVIMWEFQSPAVIIWRLVGTIATSWIAEGAGTMDMQKQLNERQFFPQHSLVNYLHPAERKQMGY